MSELCFPKEILSQHQVTLGKTGAGKSSVLRYQVEYLLRHKKRVCVIDPKGDWWGLKSSGDGKGPGFPVITFGAFKNDKATDVPINPQSGKHVAELIASGNRPCIIGFRGWMPSEMAKFWLDFSSTIFNADCAGLYLVIDECHHFGPKERMQGHDENLGLHWMNRLLGEGRGLGLVMMLASQRPAKVHNNVLTQCETLIAMRVIHASDRDAVEVWVKGCGDKTIGAEVLNTLASMQRGEAWVWSPEVGFGPKRVQFPLFNTFDSFAPPQQQKTVSAKSWAGVDLKEVTEKLATVVEQAKANDPTELKKQVRELQAQIKKIASAPTPAAPPKVETKIKTVPVIKEPDIARLEKIINKAEAIGSALRDAIVVFKQKPAWPEVRQGMNDRARQATPPAHMQRQPAPPRPPPPPRQTNGEPGEFTLGKGERSILTACIHHPDGCERNQLTVLTGYKRSSRDTYLQRLVAAGLVEARGDVMMATEAGIAALPGVDPLPVGEELQKIWLGKLGGGERTIFETLLSLYPDEVSRDSLSEQTNYKRSSRDTYLQRLSARKLIVDCGRGMVKASDRLFA